MVTADIWPALDYSRVPYRLYHDAEVYAEEQERIFRGKTWNFLALDVEIPNPGDFRATYVGETPVIVNRDENGEIHAFVNRCAHRGALVRRELSGNATSHTCIYHQWCYDLHGGLTSIPFRRGIRGKGGMGPDFDMGRHGMRRLKVGQVNGAIFGTLPPPRPQARIPTHRHDLAHGEQRIGLFLRDDADGERELATRPGRHRSSVEHRCAGIG